MPAITLIEDGIVRNITKKDFWLRIPRDQDRPAKTIMCPAATTHNVTTDVTLDAHDFFAVENDLVRLDRAKILLIIKYPYVNPLLSGKVLIYQDTPPADINSIWISSITGDHYIYDTTLNMWRSLNPEIVPFIRNFSQGVPLYPYGAQTSAPIYVNATTGRNYLVYRLFGYVNDRTVTPNGHKVYLQSTGYADEELTLINGTTSEIFPTTNRILSPSQTLTLRHGTHINAFYISLTVELSELISPV